MRRSWIIIAALCVASCSSRISEKSALDFLYDSMSIADVGDYDKEFFEQNTRIALRAREEMSWGRDVPEDYFLHFVLPPRVNNERLDSFRMVWYETLKKRVSGMTMHDAALEINHWCHEHVSYVPSDARTSSPLATMRSAEGRCGEESVLTVAALRTVGIPARQVYTPRWAHTDDNHAWVEAWIDGAWHFMGACEPEPELDMAWFNEPASRAMLMHTLVYGDYHGPEDVIRRTHSFTEINVIGNYVDTRRNSVIVIDEDGKPTSGARVEFCIYNYAEMYPAAAVETDETGEASLHSGRGDMFVWASKNGHYGFGLLTDTKPTITIKLEHTDTDSIHTEWDITPPANGRIPYEVSDEALARNKQRLAYEDSLRHAYMATFPNHARAQALLQDIITDEGLQEPAAQQIVDARGNWQEVLTFIRTNPNETAIRMLNDLSRKDLRDTPAAILAAALRSSANQGAFVLNPRIANEFIQPYQEQIRQAIGSGEKSASEIIAWVNENIELADSLNPRRLQATPAGVLKVRKADSRSRDIFTVAALRSYGIPARIDVLTSKAQYRSTGEEWIDVTSTDEKQAPQGYVKIFYLGTGDAPTDPEYYRHFTISRIENGRRRLLEFDGGDATELGAEAKASTFRKPFALDEGTYMLTSGSRMASGKALVDIKIFQVKQGQTTAIRLDMRQSAEDLSVIGAMDPEMPYETSDGNETSILSTTGRGYFLVAVMGYSDEPSRHAIIDLETLQDWNRPILILGRDNTDTDKLMVAGKLCMENLHYGTDTDGQVKEMLAGSEATLPVIAVCDSFGRIVYMSSGYNTSLAAQLSSVRSKL